MTTTEEKRRFGVGTTILLVLGPLIYFFTLMGSLPYEELGDLLPDFSQMKMGHYFNIALFLIFIFSTAVVMMKKKWGLWLFVVVSVVMLIFSIIPTPSSPGLAGLIGLLAAFFLYLQRDRLS